MIYLYLYIRAFLVFAAEGYGALGGVGPKTVEVRKGLSSVRLSKGWVGVISTPRITREAALQSICLAFFPPA